MNDEVLSAYRSCRLCPNYCEVDRSSGKRGRCGETNEVRVAWSGLHRGEEPPVAGTHGSGMIFFCGCPLHCAYCQNHQISGGAFGGDSSVGVPLSIEELAKLMLELERFGANNLNLVTGTHYIPSIIAALELARGRGLRLQVVWNSSGYESVEGLKLIDPYVDLHLVDVKTLDALVAARFCGLARYSQCIEPVMEYLVSHHDKVWFDERDNMHGLLVRHLLFPGTMEATVRFLRWFAKRLKDHAWLSMMVQFVPPKQDVVFPQLTDEEYESLIDLFDELGIDDGFIQELGDDIKWIPDFTQDEPFPEPFADVLPYFLELKQSNSL
ncbi:MAG: radical SAM protein [Sphaerochaetaceae bacterium]|nr:radical SAM protein [Sphaerochaetaceae bacterium]